MHHLADGLHRLHTNRRIGARTVACDVRAGTLLDALLYAYGANKSHGLRRTSADKRKAVLGMLTQFASWSDRQIAKHVGVDGKTVAAQREAHCENSAVTPTERTYTTKHGTTATMNVAGQKAAGKAKAANHNATTTPPQRHHDATTTPTTTPTTTRASGAKAARRAMRTAPRLAVPTELRDRAPLRPPSQMACRTQRWRRIEPHWKNLPVNNRRRAICGIPADASTIFSVRSGRLAQHLRCGRFKCAA